MSVIEFDWYINNSWLEPWPCSHHSSGTTKCSANGEIKIPQKASVNKNKTVIQKINKNKSQRDHNAHIKLDKKYAEPRCSYWPRSALNYTLAIQRNEGNHRSVQGFSICIAKNKNTYAKCFQMAKDFTTVIAASEQVLLVACCLYQSWPPWRPECVGTQGRACQRACLPLSHPWGPIRSLPF